MVDKYNFQSKNIPIDILPPKIDSVKLIDGGMNNQNILINNSLLIKKFYIRDEINDPVKARFSREIEALKQLKGQSYSPMLLNHTSKKSNYIFSRNWIKGYPITVERINKKERILALKSAIAATAQKQHVLERGHVLSEEAIFPLICIPATGLRLLLR